jgi:hypothetical protein
LEDAYRYAELTFQRDQLSQQADQFGKELEFRTALAMTDQERYEAMLAFLRENADLGDLDAEAMGVALRDFQAKYFGGTGGTGGNTSTGDGGTVEYPDYPPVIDDGTDTGTGTITRPREPFIVNY